MRLSDLPNSVPCTKTDLESDLAIGGKLLAKVPLARLWEIKERAEAVRLANLMDEFSAVEINAIRIIQAIDDAIKEAQRIAEEK